VESGEHEGSECDSGEDEDERGEEREEGDKDAAAPQKPVQKTATLKQKMVVQKSVQKKATQKSATSPVAGKECKPTISPASPMAGKNGSWLLLPRLLKGIGILFLVSQRRSQLIIMLMIVGLLVRRRYG
jgi:hypothetical protein